MDSGNWWKPLFERVIVINLESRPDRLAQVKGELAKYDLPCEVYKAVEDKESGARGIYHTHRSLMTSLWVENIQGNVLVLEDDATLSGDLKGVLTSCMETLNQSVWHALFLGANVHGKMLPTINPKMLRLTEAYALHAVIYSPVGIHRCYNIITNHHYSKNQPIDVLYAKHLIPDKGCYITNPMLSLQRPSYSDIEKRDVDYTGMLQHKFKINMP